MKRKIIKCSDCKKEMMSSKVETCIFEKIILNGKIYKRNTTQFDVNKRCHDCNIVNKKGNVHHFCCDMERCPRCKGQLLSCDCEGKRTL